MQTWPAARKACTWLPGEPRMASIAGGTRTWETSIEKLPMPCRRARYAAMALAGAVVSNPTAKNTTCRSGWRTAILKASNGE